MEWLAYWRSLISDHDIPCAHTLCLIEQKPRLCAYAAWMGVTETDFHIRVVGEALRDLYGGGYAQQNLSAFDFGPAQAALHASLHAAVADRFRNPFESACIVVSACTPPSF